MYAEEINPAVIDDLIEKIAQKVVDAKMEAPAILALETMKPLSWIGSQMGRIFLTPWVGVFGYSAMDKADKYMMIFEKRENVDRLIKRIEKLSGISNRSK
ncbi:MAG: hypothetical protein ACE5OO_00655 [Candidatus Bathyarchaeia archaeon]